MSQNSFEHVPHAGTEPGEHRPSRHAERPSAMRHRRLRYVYFGLASGWGFATGCVAVLASLDALAHPLRLSSALGVKLVVAGGVALVGGFVVALAYREAVRRNP